MDYQVLFGERYTEAIGFIQDNPWMEDSLRHYGVDADLALSMVFPELIRYSYLRDHLETAALFTLYVQYGQKYADFSVGPFQMKPSFAERIESRALSEAGTTWFDCEDFRLPDGTKARKARVLRLSQPLWQVRYLALACQFIGKDDPSHHSKSMADRVAYFATAYNYDFSAAEQEIVRAQGRPSFHTALLAPDVLYHYHDIALNYYTKRTTAWTGAGHPGKAGK